MHPRAFNFTLTPEDRRTIERWKWRLAPVYGAALLILALMLVAAPRHKAEIAGARSAPVSSAAAMLDGRATP